jgi:hypothetical protein
MASNDWEKEFRHRELMDLQRENTQDIISAIEEDREFNIFWDTLSRSEKKRWLEAREEEERRQRKAKQRQDVINYFSGTDFRPSRLWLGTLSLVFSAIPTFVIQLTVGNSFLAIVAGLLSCTIFFGLRLTKESKDKFEKLVASRLVEEEKPLKSLLLAIKTKTEENRQGLDIGFFKAITKGLVIIPFFFLSPVLFVIPLANAVSNSLETTIVRSEAIDVLEVINSKTGIFLAEYIASAMPAGSIQNSEEWAFAQGWMDASFYWIKTDLEDPNLSIVESPYFPTVTGECAQYSTSSVANDAKFYEVEIETSFTSLRSQDHTERSKFVFVKENGKLYPFIDICGLKYWGTAFFNQEQTEETLMREILSTSSSRWDHSVSCPLYLFGTIGQSFECEVLNSNGELDSRIKATVAQLNPPGFTSIWVSLD